MSGAVEISLTLSVCVPTYNRRTTLEQCLDQLLPQITGKPDVELVISDNASTDETEEFLKSIALPSNVRIFRNETNLGLDGNLVTFLDRATGRYIALMSDDDIPANGYIDAILVGIGKYNPCVLYSNYYAFHGDWKTPAETFFPTQDVQFHSLGEAVLYCGLGHFSAVTFERASAIKALADVKYLRDGNFSRGYSFLTLTFGAYHYSDRDGVFLGKHTVAVRSPESVDYDVIQNTAIQYLDLIAYWNRKGSISDEFLKKKIRQACSDLPYIIIGHRVRNRQKFKFSLLWSLFHWYSRVPKFYFLCLPLLLAPVALLELPYRILRPISHFRRSIKALKVLSKN